MPWTAAATTFALPLVPALIILGLLHRDNPWAERYAYVPSIGLAIAVAILATRVATTHVRLMAGVAIPALALLAWRRDRARARLA